MARATTIKDALRNLEEKTGKNPIEMKEIGLQFQYPPIERMDNTLSTLKRCEKLSLSTNMIEKITGLNGLKNLKILSLGRNYIKSLSGIESVSETLEELWISYNLIEKLKQIETMKALKVLYISNNLIKDWSEFNRMSIPPNLIEILFIGNPLIENMDENVYRNEAMRRLQNLKILDGEPVIRGV